MSRDPLFFITKDHFFVLLCHSIFRIKVGMNKDMVSVFDLLYLYLTLSCFILLAPVHLCAACKRMENSLADGLKRNREGAQQVLPT